jgi:fermentation-respiration switch protein FrsA (DUF1100 family)
LVTIAAVALPLGIIERMAPSALEAWRRNGLRGESGGRIGSGFLDDLARVDPIGAATRVTAATLVTHGEDDHVVPVADAYALYAALPEPKALAITPACDHRFTEPDHLDRLLDRTVDWIVVRLPPGLSA